VGWVSRPLDSRWGGITCPCRLSEKRFVASPAPALSMLAASWAGPISFRTPVLHAALRIVWPPATKGHVSSSFIAMRPKVRAHREPKHRISGSPLRPSGFTLDQTHLHSGQGVLQLAFAAVACIHPSRLFSLAPSRCLPPVARYRTPPTPKPARWGKPIGLEGTAAVSTIRSAQRGRLPYFCLIGQEQRRPCRGCRIQPAVDRSKGLVAGAPTATGPSPVRIRCRRCARPCV